MEPRSFSSHSALPLLYHNMGCHNPSFQKHLFMMSSSKAELAGRGGNVNKRHLSRACYTPGTLLSLLVMLVHFILILSFPLLPLEKPRHQDIKVLSGVV
jgi:hypothetical protein